MNQINTVTIGKLIEAHREGDEKKFRNYVDFIAKAYEEQGNDRADTFIISTKQESREKRRQKVLDTLTAEERELLGV